MKAREQLTARQLERLRQPAAGPCLAKGQHVAPEGTRSEPKLVHAAGLDDVGAQVGAEKMQRLPKGAPSGLGVEFRPEKGQEDVAPEEPRGLREREIDEEREPLGLRQDLSKLPPTASHKLGGPDQTESHHTSADARPITVTWQVTAAEHGRDDGPIGCAPFALITTSAPGAPHDHTSRAAPTSLP